MDNFIEIYENALSDDLCDLLVNEFEHYHGDYKTYKGVTTGGLHRPEIKDSWDFDLLKRWRQNYDNSPNSSMSFYDGQPYDPILEKIYDAGYNTLMRYDEKYDFHGEFINLKEINYWPVEELPKVRNMRYLKRCFNIQPYMLIKKYEKIENQGYHIFHSDFDIRSNTWLKRSHVIMFYLNDVEKGGETEWYYQKLKIKPKKGTAVVWPVYATHKHKGHIPLSNSKYILNLWVEPNVTKVEVDDRWWH